jgi:hypothetical protein
LCFFILLNRLRLRYQHFCIPVEDQSVRLANGLFSINSDLEVLFLNRIVIYHVLQGIALLTHTSEIQALLKSVQLQGEHNPAVKAHNWSQLFPVLECFGVFRTQSKRNQIIQSSLL